MLATVLCFVNNREQSVLTFVLMQLTITTKHIITGLSQYYKGRKTVPQRRLREIRQETQYLLGTKERTA